MTITVVNAVSNVEIGRDFWTPTTYFGAALPGGLADNDTVIMAVRSENCQLNTPSGWTLINTVTTASGGATTIRIYLFKKDTVTTADSGTTINIVATTGGNPSIWYSSFALRSSDGKMPVVTAQAYVTNNGSDMQVSLPAVTATFASELMVCVYSKTSYDSGSYNEPSGWTAITTSGQSMANVRYVVRAQGAASPSGNMGWTGGGANVGAQAVILRFDLLPLQATLSETIQTTESLPVRWTANPVLSQTVGMSELTLFGRRYLGTLADTLAMADIDLRWINPLFSLVDLSDALNLAEASDAVKVLSMYDPVKNRNIYTNFRPISPLYTDAYSAYAAWCAEAGVASSGSDATLSAGNASWSLVDVGFSPILYGLSTMVFFSGAGVVSLSVLSNDSGADAMWGQPNLPASNVGWQNYISWPADNPALIFGLADNDYNYTSATTFAAKLGFNYPTPKDEALFYVVYRSQQSGQTDRIGMAIRLRPAYLEIVVSPVDPMIYHAHEFIYQVENYVTADITTAKILGSTWTSGTVYHYLTDDKSGLLSRLQDAFGVAGPAQPHLIALASRTDDLRVSERLSPAQALLMSQALTLADANSVDIRYGAVLADMLRVVDTQALNSTLHTTVAENLKLLDVMMRVFPVAQSETIQMQDVARTLLGVRVLEALGLLDAALPKATIYKTVAELLRVSDDLRRFLSGMVSESIGVAEAPTYKYNILRQITETVGIVDALTKHLLVRVEVSEGVGIDDAQLLKMIFKGTVAEGVKISAAYLRPGDDVTTWVVNTMTGATTEYTNYGFNSFAQIGHKYLGASTAGLFELNGGTDAGTDIIAHLKGGFAQFNGSRYTGFKAAYLGMRGTGEFFFKLDAGDGNTYTYKIVAQDMQTTKVQLGKGLRARYFAYELISTGQDFDLDTIEFVPMMAQRRV